MSDNQAADQLLAWCTSVVGPFEIVSGQHRPDGRSSISRLQTSTGYCYLKVHDQHKIWEREVHGYELWAPAFGDFTPRLLAVHEDGLPALLIDELPGKVLEDVDLPVEQEQAAWRTAGQRLASLHGYATGEFFGPCHRDGSPQGAFTTDAVKYVRGDLDREITKANAAGYLDDEEFAVVHRALHLTPAFAGERPVACHRDYCPYNWLISEQGAWAGVIDFEFAYWDVRVADFSRYPDWEWMDRPDLLESLFEGYGRKLTGREKEQQFVAYVQYALSAITWGMEASYFGFVEEGRKALKELAKMLA